MKYWDSSAIVPLLARQDHSLKMMGLLRADSGVITWWGTSIECCFAIMRLQRMGYQASVESEKSLKRLRELREVWEEVVAGSELRAMAERLLRVHPLRAADAIQLAAAIRACGGYTERLSFVSLDESLSDAARKEGFEVLP